MRKKYSNEFLINTLKDYATKIKRTPTYLEFELDKSVPSATVYKNRFDTWNNALELAGLKVNAIRKYSKNEIVNDALRFYDYHKRSPFYYELNYSMTIINKYWSGWKDFLIDIGLPLNFTYSKVTSRDEMVIFLQNLFESLGKIPTTTDVENAGVGRHLFLTKFGNFKNALIASKIVDEEYFKTIEEKIPASLNIIKTFYNKNKRPPTVNEYEEISRKLNIAGRKALEHTLNMRFTEICFKTIGVANQYKRSKEQLLNDLKLLKQQLGRTPKANELLLYGLAEKKQYYRTFGMTYIELIEQQGWELSTPKAHYKTENELLEDYKKLYDILGRLPFFSDIDEQDWMSSSATYKKYFGDLTNIWDALEIEIDEEILNKNYGLGYTCLDKNNNICRSIPEMIISNILIDLGINFIKEYPYKNSIPNLKNKYKFDWYLTDYDISIEYFGLFIEDALKMDNFIGRYSRKVLKKIELCDTNKVKLIDLYPEDMENIEEVILKRLNIYGISFGS